jgi:hypothetical protein
VTMADVARRPRGQKAAAGSGDKAAPRTGRRRFKLSRYAKRLNSPY